jgi:mono/diheme cytochrome c family protein
VPNNGLDAGAILALTPTAQAAGLDGLLNGWGPGRFDVRALDVPGVDRNPLEDGVDNPTTYPPIWNFLDLSEQNYLIGWDGLFLDNGVTNNALASISEAVYDLIFHGNGAFGIPPFAVDGEEGGGTIPPELSITPPAELVTALIESEVERPGNDILPAEELLDVQEFMRSIASPSPGPFDEPLAEAGFELFHGKANCWSCHESAEFTGPGLHVITENPPEGGLAAGLKVPGLRGIAQTAPYFHDGSAADLAAVVDRYVDRGGDVPMLSTEERSAIVEYLESL